jgi:hypothetical protein
MNFHAFAVRGLGFAKKRTGRRSFLYVAPLRAEQVSQALESAALPVRFQLTKSATFFPEGNEVPGWSKGETRTFEAERLWEYIDGDADRYIQAGVVRTLTTDYRYQNKIEAAADVYVMKAPEGARKIFDSESSVGSQPLQLGDSARVFPASLTFRKGPYFVRLVAYQEAPDIGKALTELARAIEQKLKA